MIQPVPLDAKSPSSQADRVASHLVCARRNSTGASRRAVTCTRCRLDFAQSPELVEFGARTVARTRIEPNRCSSGFPNMHRSASNRSAARLPELRRDRSAARRAVTCVSCRLDVSRLPEHIEAESTFIRSPGWISTRPRIGVAFGCPNTHRLESNRANARLPELCRDRRRRSTRSHPRGRADSMFVRLPERASNLNRFSRPITRGAFAIGVRSSAVPCASSRSESRLLLGCPSRRRDRIPLFRSVSQTKSPPFFSSLRFQSDEPKVPLSASFPKR
jgi:hypothetical protein